MKWMRDPAGSFMGGHVVNSIHPGLSMSQYRQRAPTARPSTSYGSGGHAEMACWIAMLTLVNSACVRLTMGIAISDVQEKGG